MCIARRRRASPCVTDGTETLPGDENGPPERTAEDICTLNPPPQPAARLAHASLRTPLEFIHQKRTERIHVRGSTLADGDASGCPQSDGTMEDVHIFPGPSDPGGGNRASEGRLWLLTPS